MSYRGRQLRLRDPKTVGAVPKLASPPKVLRRANLDNLALVPGSLLPFKEKYQQIANDLPSGDVLIILPSEGNPQRKTLETVTALLKAKGHQVTTLPAEYFG